MLFDPAAHRTIRATDLHHTSDYTPYEGLEVSGSVRSVFVRGRPVILDGTFVGRRGAGSYAGSAADSPKSAARDGVRRVRQAGLAVVAGRSKRTASAPKTTQPRVKLIRAATSRISRESSPPPAAIASSVAAPSRTAPIREKTAVKNVAIANSSEPTKNASSPK